MQHIGDHPAYPVLYRGLRTTGDASVRGGAGLCRRRNGSGLKPGNDHLLILGAVANRCAESGIAKQQLPSCGSHQRAVGDPVRINTQPPTFGQAKGQRGVVLTGRYFIEDENASGRQPITHVGQGCREIGGRMDDVRRNDDVVTLIAGGRLRYIAELVTHESVLGKTAARLVQKGMGQVSEGVSRLPSLQYWEHELTGTAGAGAHFEQLQGSCLLTGKPVDDLCHDVVEIIRQGIVPVHRLDQRETAFGKQHGQRVDFTTEYLRVARQTGVE
ncbi:hypothetical protein D3C85_1096370 [compost metagenome]